MKKGKNNNPRRGPQSRIEQDAGLGSRRRDILRAHQASVEQRREDARKRVEAAAIANAEELSIAEERQRARELEEMLLTKQHEEEERLKQLDGELERAEKQRQVEERLLALEEKEQKKPENILTSDVYHLYVLTRNFGELTPSYREEIMQPSVSAEQVSKAIELGIRDGWNDFYEQQGWQRPASKEF